MIPARSLLAFVVFFSSVLGAVSAHAQPDLQKRIAVLPFVGGQSARARASVILGLRSHVHLLEAETFSRALTSAEGQTHPDRIAAACQHVGSDGVVEGVMRRVGRNWMVEVWVRDCATGDKVSPGGRTSYSMRNLGGVRGIGGSIWGRLGAAILATRGVGQGGPTPPRQESSRRSRQSPEAPDPRPPARDEPCIFEEEEPPEGFPGHADWIRRRNRFLATCEEDRVRRIAEEAQRRQVEARRAREEALARARAEEAAQRQEAARREQEEAEARERVNRERLRRETAEARRREEAAIEAQVAEYRERLRRRRLEGEDPEELDSGRDGARLRRRGSDPEGEGDPPRRNEGSPGEGDEFFEAAADYDRPYARDSEPPRRRGSSREDPPSEEEIEEPPDDPADANEPRRSALFQLRAGVAFMTRSMRVEVISSATPRSYDAPGYPEATIAAEVFPLAWARRAGAASGIGLFGTFRRHLYLQTSGQDLAGQVITVPTGETELLGGLMFRTPFGTSPTSPVLAVGLGFGFFAFELDPESMAQLDPNVQMPTMLYQNAVASAAVSVPVSRSGLALELGAGYRYVIDVGQAARDIFGATTRGGYGLSASAGLSGEAAFILEGIMWSFTGDYLVFKTKFTGPSSAGEGFANAFPSGTDSYLRLQFSAGYRHR